MVVRKQSLDQYQAIVNDKGQPNLYFIQYMQILNEAVGSGGSTDLTTVNARLDALEANDTVIEGDITTIEGSITTLSGTVSTLSGTVSTLSTTVSGHTTSIGTLTSDLATLTTTVSGHTTSIGTINTNISNIQAKDLVSAGGSIVITNGSLSSATDADFSVDVQVVLDSISSTQGAVLYRNASDWVALSPGTSGHFLKTQGAGANPTWATVTGTGSSARTLISSGTLSGGVVDLTGLTLNGHREIEIEITDCTFSTIGRPRLEFYIAGTLATNQIYSSNQSSSSGGSVEQDGIAAASGIAFLDSVSNNWAVVTTTTNADAYFFGTVRLRNPQSSRFKAFSWDGMGVAGNSGAGLYTYGGGFIRSTSAITGVKLVSHIGTISAATVNVYGIA